MRFCEVKWDWRVNTRDILQWFARWDSKVGDIFFVSPAREADVKHSLQIEA